MSGARTCLRSELPQTPGAFSFIPRHMPPGTLPYWSPEPPPPPVPGFFCHIRPNSLLQIFFPKKSTQKTKVLLFKKIFPQKIGLKKMTPLKKTKIPRQNHFSKVGIVKKFFPRFFHSKNLAEIQLYLRSKN